MGASEDSHLLKNSSSVANMMLRGENNDSEYKKKTLFHVCVLMFLLIQMTKGICSSLNVFSKYLDSFFSNSHHEMKRQKGNRDEDEKLSNTSRNIRWFVVPWMDS